MSTRRRSGERFKAASSRINKQHQEHFETLKGEQVKNLELKTGLCVATEELSSQPLTTRKEWNRASDRLLEIQKTWKTIGFAPKKDNNRIYERFRTACDRFFEAKRQFYAGMKTEMEHNLQLKTEICEAAESLMNSEEWKKATDELIALQARGKQIGPCRGVIRMPFGSVSEPPATSSSSVRRRTSQALTANTRRTCRRNSPCWPKWPGPT